MSGTIGLLATYVGGAMRSYETAVSKAVCEVAEERGYKVRIFSGGLLRVPDGYESVRNYVYDLVTNKTVDGVFFLSSALSIFLKHEEFEHFCRQFSPLPLVSIGVPVKGVTSVVIDNRLAMKDLTLHLIEKHGVKKPLYLGGPSGNREARERGEGFLDALTEAGLRPNPAMILEGTFHKDSGYQLVRDYFREDGAPFDVIVSANDEMADGAISYLAERKLTAPKDFLITGFDDLEISRLMVPSLTSVHQQVYGMARTACELLCDRIEGKEVTENTVYPTRLIARDSCGCGIFTSGKYKSAVLPETREGIKAFLTEKLPPLNHKARKYLNKGFEDFFDALEITERDIREAKVLEVMYRVLSGFEKYNIDFDVWENFILYLESTRLGKSSLGQRFWDEMRYRVCEVGQLVVRRQKVLSERLESILRQIGEEIINTYSVEQLSEILCKHLPGIPLKGLELYLFEKDSSQKDTLFPVIRWERPGRMESFEKGLSVPSELLILPDSPLTRSHSLVFEALSFRTEVFGLLVLAFDKPDGTVCNSLREMISGAMKNITFWDETRERTRLMEILYRTEKSFSTWPDENNVVIEIQKALHGWLHNDYTRIWRALPERDDLVPVSLMVRGEFVRVMEKHISPIQISGEPESFENGEFSGMRIPVYGGGQLVIVIDIGYDHSSHFAFTEAVLRTLGMFANQAVLALNNARLYRKTISSSERIRDLNSELALKLKRLTSLRTIDIAITDSPDQDSLMQVLMVQIREQLAIDAVSVLLFKPDDGLLIHAGSLGFSTEALRHTRLKLGEGLAGRAARDKKTVMIENFDTGSESLHKSKQLKDEGFKGYCAAPLLSRGELKGVLELFQRSSLNPGEEWKEFLEVLAGQTAIALDHSELVKGLQTANEDLVKAWDATIEGWSRALDFRDEETEGHSRRVAEMAKELALFSGIDETLMVHVHRGAYLHDIGKMGIPDSILLKPGPLDKREMEIMKKHPEFAREMLSSISFLGPALDIPLYHHEKWDGTGYPEGLKGEEIPLFARIFALVDVWDALTSDRPYRKAWTRDKTAEHIKSLSGSHFDPGLTGVFLKLRGF